jgi:hypothetical protein
MHKPIKASPLRKMTRIDDSWSSSPTPNDDGTHSDVAIAQDQTTLSQKETATKPRFEGPEGDAQKQPESGKGIARAGTRQSALRRLPPLVEERVIETIGKYGVVDKFDSGDDDGREHSGRGDGSVQQQSGKRGRDDLDNVEERDLKMRKTDRSQPQSRSFESSRDARK